MGLIGINKPIPIQSEVNIFIMGALKGHSIPHEASFTNAYLILVESFDVSYSTSLRRQSSMVIQIEAGGNIEAISRGG